MSYSTLGKYYDDLFNLSYHHNFPISEMMSLIPFERDLFISMLNTYLANKAEMERLQSLRDQDIQRHHGGRRGK